MFLIGVGSFLLLVWVLWKLNQRDEKRITKDVERVQMDMYRLIDLYTEDEYERRLMKTDMDVFFHDSWKSMNRDYRPQNIEEASTEASRKRYKKLKKSMKDADYVMRPATREEFKNACAKNAGMTREEWDDAVQRFKKNMNIK